jgi:hypothetical protein
MTLYSNEPTHCTLPRICSDFYGRTPELLPQVYHVVTLHLTWEYDVIRLKGKDEFMRGMDMLEWCYANSK